MITEQDVIEAKKLGYQLDVLSKLAAEQINQYFPGIELMILLGQFENLLSAHAKSPVYKRLVIDVTPEPRFQIVYLSSNYSDENEGLTLSRIFRYENNQLIAEHHFLVLPESARGKGLAKRILAACLDQYLNMGVKEIHVHAGLKDGGLVWARLGFKATRREEVEAILKSAEQVLAGTPEKEEELELVKAIFEAYYQKEPYGGSFPIISWAAIESMHHVLKMSENNWHGRIDLTNPQELHNFKINVGREQ